MTDFEKALDLIKTGALTKAELDKLGTAIQSRILDKPSVKADISV